MAVPDPREELLTRPSVGGAAPTVLKLRHLRPDRDLKPDDAMRNGVAC
jgi:hypothetical protein